MYVPRFSRISRCAYRRIERGNGGLAPCYTVDFVTWLFECIGHVNRSLNEDVNWVKLVLGIGDEDQDFSNQG